MMIVEMQASVCGEQPLVRAHDLLLECWISKAVEYVKRSEGVRCRTSKVQDFEFKLLPQCNTVECKATLAEMLYWNNA
jgi:hypothetical protein